MRLLFVCSRNRLRSPTAEQVFAGVAGVQARSAGLSADAEDVLTADLIDWADLILVMEPIHRTRVNRQFGRELRAKRVVCLNIPDDYEFMDPNLIALLWERVPLSVPALVAERPH